MRIEEIDQMNHILGAYVGRAVNASKQHPYPKRPFSKSENVESNHEMTDTQMEEMARKLTQSMGGKVI